MAADLRTTLFGKLAIRAGFITEDQFKEALRIQADYEAKKGQQPRIGDVLKAKGYLRDGQVQAIMRRLKEMAAQGAKAKPSAKEKKAARFGEIAVGFGMLTVNQVKEALIFQRKLSNQNRTQKPPKIGEILVKQGHLMAHQVRAILMEQNKRIAKCPICNAGINVSTFKPGDKVQCGQCHAALMVDPKGKSLILDPSSTLNADPSKTRINQRIANYIIEARIGMDSTGKTYKGLDIGGRGSAVIKVYSKTALENSEDAEELSRRIRVAAKLKHDNLRKLLSMGRINNRLYVVMEYLEGHSLHRILDEVRTLPYSKVLAFAFQIGQCLKEVHAAGLYHGDIRPSNILFTKDGSVKLGGLGLNLRTTDNLLNIVESGGRAPFYIAPEQVVDESRLDARSDIYSLGACMYHALTGRPPFEGSSPFEVLVRFTEDPLTSIREINPNVPATIATIVEQMIAPEPDERYQDVDEMLAAFKKPKKSKKGGNTGKTAKKDPGSVSSAEMGRATSDIIEGPTPMSLLASSAEMTPANISKSLDKANVIEEELPLYYRKKLERESQPSRLPWIIGSLIGVILLCAAAIVYAFATADAPVAPPEEFTPIISAAMTSVTGDKADDFRARIEKLRELLPRFEKNPEATNRVQLKIKEQENELVKLDNRARADMKQVEDEVHRRVTLDGTVTERLARHNFGEALTILDKALDANSDLNRKYAGTDALAASKLPGMRDETLRRAREFADAVNKAATDPLNELYAQVDAVSRLTPKEKDDFGKTLDGQLERALDLWRRLLDDLRHDDLARIADEVSALRTDARRQVSEVHTKLGEAVANQQEAAIQRALNTLRDDVQAFLDSEHGAITAAKTARDNFEYESAISKLELVQRNVKTQFDQMVRRSMPKADSFELPPDLRAAWAGKLETAGREFENAKQNLLRETDTLLIEVRTEASFKDAALNFYRDRRLRGELARNRYELADGTGVNFSQFTPTGIVVARESGGNVEINWDCRDSRYFEPVMLGRLLVDMFELRRAQGQVSESDGREALGAALFLHRQGAYRAAAQLIRRAREWGANVTEYAASIESAYETVASRELDAYIAEIDRAAGNPGAKPRKWWNEIQAQGEALLKKFDGTQAAANAAPLYRQTYIRCFFLGAGVAAKPEKTREISFADGLPTAMGVFTSGGQVSNGSLVVGEGGKFRANSAGGKVIMIRLRLRVELDDRGRAGLTFELPDSSRIEIDHRPGRTTDATLHHPKTIRKFSDVSFDLTSTGWHEIRLYLAPGDGKLTFAGDYTENSPSISDPSYTQLDPFVVTVRNGKLLLDAVQIIEAE